MNTDLAIGIALFVAGLLAIAFGLRIVIRARAHIVLRSRDRVRQDVQFHLEGWPARLWGACVLVIGLRIVVAYLPVWFGSAELSDVSVGGTITVLALIGLVAAAVWHGLRKFRSVFDSPEFQKKLAEKVEESRREKEKEA